MKHLEDFTRQLKISVDTRIQRSKHQLNQGVLSLEPPLGRHDAAKGVEQVFQLIEKHSRCISVLLKIRSHITPKNALRVLALLDSDEYLTWGDEDIKAFFRPHGREGRQSAC